MALDDLLAAVRQWWLLVVTAVVVAAAIGFVAAATAATAYTSSARVLVVLVQVANPTAETEMTQGLAAEEFVRSRIMEYTSFADTEAYLQRVVDTHKLPLTREQLGRNMSMSSPKDSSLITVTTRMNSPVLAADVANASADELAKVLLERESLIPFRAVVVERAVVAASAIAPELWRTVVQSAVLGLIIGVSAAVRLALQHDRREHVVTA